MKELMDAHDATYYEDHFRKVGDSRADRYLPLYEAAAALIPNDASVVELGSGIGRFGALVMNRVASYLGLDFAPALVAEAKRHAGRDVFQVADLRTDEIPQADVYVALEVLEHLDDDMAILKRLPKGSRVVMSVPSFHSPSHLRHFAEEGSAATRYDAALRIDHEEQVRLPNGAYFHLLSGLVRARQKKVPAGD